MRVITGIAGGAGAGGLSCMAAAGSTELMGIVGDRCVRRVRIGICVDGGLRGIPITSHAVSSLGSLSRKGGLGNRSLRECGYTACVCADVIALPSNGIGAGAAERSLVTFVAGLVRASNATYVHLTIWLHGTMQALARQRRQADGTVYMLPEHVWDHVADFLAETWRP